MSEQERGHGVHEHEHERERESGHVHAQHEHSQHKHTHHEHSQHKHTHHEHEGEHEHDHDHHDGVGSCADIPVFTNTEMIVREDILAKAKELANLISTSSEVEFYKKAEKQIQLNAHVQDLISAIKKKQKEIVAFETFENKQMVAKIEAEIQTLQNELDEIPIVQEFQQTQIDINYLLQLIMTVVRDTVSDKIEVEQG
jgi:cell fate (sporulation/competence/biofilm development) regulator YmcA (YheA/YmcA/DUF963 family)